MSNPDQINEKVTSFLEETKSLNILIEQLKKANSLDSLSNKLPLLDCAQLNSSLAYCLSSLYNSTCLNEKILNYH